MSTFVQVINDQTATIRACGRACPDMHPSTLPAIPVPPPVSLSAILRAHPDMAIDPEWLEGMEAGETVH